MKENAFLKQQSEKEQRQKNGGENCLTDKDQKETSDKHKGLFLHHNKSAFERLSLILQMAF
jgi:hypothetical protein